MERPTDQNIKIISEQHLAQTGHRSKCTAKEKMWFVAAFKITQDQWILPLLCYQIVICLLI